MATSVSTMSNPEICFTTLLHITLNNVYLFSIKASKLLMGLNEI